MEKKPIDVVLRDVKVTSLSLEGTVEADSRSPGRRRDGDVISVGPWTARYKNVFYMADGSVFFAASYSTERA